MVFAESGGAASAGCTAGMTKYGGTNAAVFCGPATATVHAGDKTFTIRQGSCEAKVTLTNGRSRGTFSATQLTGRVVTGSFRC